MSRTRTAGAALLLLVAAGLACVLAGNGVAVKAVGCFLLGSAAVAITSWVFLLVGRSEDEHRARHPRG